MHFINIKGLVFAVRPAAQPFFITEAVGTKIGQHRLEIRTKLHTEAVNIAVVSKASPLVIYPVQIFHSLFGFFGVQFKKVSVVHSVHFPFLPAGEVSQQGHPLRSGSKHSENISLVLSVRA